MPPSKSRTKKRSSKKPSKASKSKKAVANSLTPNQKKEVKILIEPEIETKYNAALIVKNVQVQPLIASTTAGIGAGSLQPLLMPIVQGLQNNQRIGLRIHPTHCRVTGRIWIAQSTEAVLPTTDVTVKVWFLSSKRVKAYDQGGSLQSGALLDNGDQTVTDWSSATPYDPFYYDYKRIATDEFTTHSVKHYRLMKNQGTTNGDAGPGQSPNIASPSTPMIKFTETVKLPHSLQYENSSLFTSNQPTNAYPLIGMVAYNTDGSVWKQVTGSNNILCDIHTELFYKDA